MPATLAEQPVFPCASAFQLSLANHTEVNRTPIGRFERAEQNGQF